MIKNYRPSISNFILAILFFFAIANCTKNKVEVTNAATDSTQINHEEVSVHAPESDSASIMKAYSSLKNDRSFLKDLGLKGEKHFRWNDNLIKIIQGDLNGDHVDDALLFFSVEGIGGGNNWTAHYAAFLNLNKEWKYQDQIDAGGDFNDRILELKKIQDGKISGNWVGNKDESLPEIPVDYILKNGDFINTFTGLHQEENLEKDPTESVEDWAYLHANKVLTLDNILIPMSSTRKEYENLLGKNYAIKVDKTAECGTVYEDTQFLTEMVYKNLTFELSAKNKATLTVINMKGTGFKFQTENGTIDENTTVAELQKIFPKNFRSTDAVVENGSKVFSIGASYEDLWHLYFDRAGKLEKIVYQFNADRDR